LGALPEANTGQGSGVINTCLYAGLAIGTALGAVVVAQIKQHVVGPYIDRVGASLPDSQALKITLVHGSQSQVSKVLAELPSSESKNVQDVMLRAFDHGFSGVMLLMAAAAAIGVVLCAVVIRRH
jgi:uncharacterized membrane protein